MATVTNYQWSARRKAPFLLRTLVHGLQRGLPLAVIAERWEQAMPPEIFWGRLDERHNFRSTGPYPDRLITLPAGI